MTVTDLKANWVAVYGDMTPVGYYRFSSKSDNEENEDVLLKCEPWNADYVTRPGLADNIMPNKIAANRLLPILEAGDMLKRSRGFKCWVGRHVDDDQRKDRSGLLVVVPENYELGADWANLKWMASNFEGFDNRIIVADEVASMMKSCGIRHN
jgi:hypothetical protein